MAPLRIIKTARFQNAFRRRHASHDAVLRPPGSLTHAPPLCTAITRWPARVRSILAKMLLTVACLLLARHSLALLGPGVQNVGFAMMWKKKAATTTNANRSSSSSESGRQGEVTIQTGGIE